ncbi:MAG TPA: BON domain-containing protein [Candidatus Angelobacter sp.]|jgi:osmotically-inducible protein OsmY
MRKHLCNLALILTLMLGSSFAFAQYPTQNPPAVPQTQQPPTTDQSTADQTKATSNSGDVQKDIQTALQKDQSLNTDSISVQKTDTSIELTGTVPTQAAKDRAEQIARENSGGLSIKNNITVQSGSPMGPK